MLVPYSHLKQPALGLVLSFPHRAGVFYRETKGSRGREGTNERKTHHAVGGEEVWGPPSPPSLDRP